MPRNPMWGRSVSFPAKRDKINSAAAELAFVDLDSSRSLGRSSSFLMFDLTSRRDFLVLALLFEGSLAGLAAGLGWWFQIDPLARLDWDVRAVGWGLAAVIPMFGLFLLGDRFPVGPLRAIKQFLYEMLGPSLATCHWYDLLLVALVAGAGE